MRRVLMAVGTRPEAIKMAPVAAALATQPGLETLVMSTGQHRELLKRAMAMFDLVPDFDLQVMSEGQHLADVTAKVLTGTSEILRATRPDLVLVHGDTTTSVAAALAAFYQGIAVGHVEAGLRTYDLRAPFPEELNRQMTGRLATLHFAPTLRAQTHLLNEGVHEDRVWVTGNSVIDALLETLRRVDNDTSLAGEVSSRLTKTLGFDWHTSDFVLVTAHRRENFDCGIEQLCSALRALAIAHPALHFVYPVHPNPAVTSVVKAKLTGLPNLHTPEPLGYVDFAVLLRGCLFIITDSGGIQEEAPILGKPVLVARDVTERPEAVEAGAAKLSGTDPDTIVLLANELIERTTTYETMAIPRSVFGDGHAGAKIAEIVADYLLSSQEVSRTGLLG